MRHFSVVQLDSSLYSDCVEFANESGLTPQEAIEQMLTDWLENLRPAKVKGCNDHQEDRTFAGNVPEYSHS